MSSLAMIYRHPRSHLSRPLIYAASSVAAIAIGLISASDRFGQRLVTARELFGLWALGLLLASLIIGPLFAVVPRLPLRSPIMYGRRALGIVSFIFAVIHVGCYLWPLLGTQWFQLFTPGLIWVAGLVIGLFAFTDMALLAFTSTDRSVKRLGGRAWKRIHRTVYYLLIAVLVHAVLVGADFGLTRPIDVHSEPDAGALVSFIAVTLVWAVVFYLRSRGFRLWTGTAARPAR